MRLSINPQLFTDFDNPRIAVTVVKDTNNRVDISAFEPEVAALTARLQKDYGNEVISQLPKIASWREAYRKFGVKAKDYPSSIEALYNRVTRGGTIAGINPLVDIYNYISLKHMLPAGGEDTDKMLGDLQLTYASANEKPVIVLGRDEEQAPTEGEIIYKDDEGTICRKWNWREVARTILTNDTKNSILVLEALDSTTNEELLTAQMELGNLVQQYCGGDVRHFVLNKNNPSASLD
jgi:DNA/RNA-binding domain of Phe-tRNA-synthetase-like protein